MKREIMRMRWTRNPKNPDSVNPERAYRLELHISTHRIARGPYAGVTVEVLGWKTWKEGRDGNPFGRISISWQALNAQFGNVNNHVKIRHVTGSLHGQITTIPLGDLEELR